MKNVEIKKALPEIDEELKATYETRRNSEVITIDCGDDRRRTAESKAALLELGVAPQVDSYLRYFGSQTGIIRDLAITLALQYGAEALEQWPGDFDDFVAQATRRIEGSQNIVFVKHTAEKNEGNKASFDPESENGLGCAHAAGIGAVTDIATNHEPTRELALVEQPLIVGSDSYVESVIKANRDTGEHFFGRNMKTFGLGRADYQKIGGPVSVLEGDHALSSDTFVVYNFTTDQVTNPDKAHEINRPFYDVDMTQVAELLIRAFPEFKLKPKVLFAVMDQNTRATRAALASHDGDHSVDASRLAVKRYGDPEAAILYLESITT